MLLVFTYTLEMLTDVHRKGWVGRVGGCTVKRRMEADEKELENNMKTLRAEIGALRCDFFWCWSVDAKIKNACHASITHCKLRYILLIPDSKISISKTTMIQIPRLKAVTSFCPETAPPWLSTGHKVSVGRSGEGWQPDPSPPGQWHMGNWRYLPWK